MRIDLTHTGSLRESLWVYVDGVLQAEIAMRQTDLRDTLQAEVTRARVLHQLPTLLRGLVAALREAGEAPDHHVAPGGPRTAAYAQGLLRGLAGEARQEETTTYQCGWAQGLALHQALQLVEDLTQTVEG